MNPLKDNYINILGIDVYDNDGFFISGNSTPSYSLNQTFTNNNALYGPQYLIDGIHQMRHPNNTV